MKAYHEGGELKKLSMTVAYEILPLLRFGFVSALVTSSIEVKEIGTTSVAVRKESRTPKTIMSLINDSKDITPSCSNFLRVARGTPERLERPA